MAIHLRVCSALLRKTQYVINKFFHSLDICVISLNIQTKFWLKGPFCLCGVMAATGPKSRRRDAVPYQQVFFLSFLAFELALLYAGKHAL